MHSSFPSLGVPGGAPIALILTLGTLVALVWGVRSLRANPRPRRRRVLQALRSGTLLLALGMGLQPGWVIEQSETVPGRLAVLVDVSRSMSVPTADGDSRAQVARGVLREWQGTDASASVYLFGQSLRTSTLAELAEGVPSVDEASQLGEALRSITQSDRNQPVGAVVVLSDGAASTPVNVPALARSGLRVHTVALGGGGLDDDAIVAIEADPVAFLRRQARVRVSVRSSEDSVLPVTLLRDGEVVREQTVSMEAGETEHVEFLFTPEQLGRQAYSVSIPRRESDGVEENNNRSFLVRVIRDRLRVLLVAGQPSWDQRFLRSFLKRDATTDLISFFILRTSSDLTMASPDEMALIPFPTSELFNEHLGSFDLVVLQNFEYGPYQMGIYLPRIRDYVRRGGSLAMIGGELSFYSGGYTQTPIAEVLPVTLPARGSAESDTVLLGDFSPQIAPALSRHPVLRLRPDPVDNAMAWASLSSLSGVNRVTGLQGQSSTLLEHPSARTPGGAPLPVLSLGRVGEGRTLALMTDTSWRWGITTGGATGDASAYATFWDQALRWLSHDPMLEPAQVYTDRIRYGPSADAQISVSLSDERYVPYDFRHVELRLLSEDSGEIGTVSLVTDSEGAGDIALTLPARPGVYRVEASLSGRPAPLAQQWIVVEAGGDELGQPNAQPNRLAELSAATGGTHYDNASSVPRDLAAFDTTRSRSVGLRTWNPLNGGYAFFALALLFGSEWLLRRRWGER